MTGKSELIVVIRRFHQLHGWGLALRVLVGLHFSSVAKALGTVFLLD